MAGKIDTWDSISIGGIEYPRVRGTLRVVETAPPTGAYLLPRGAVSFTCELTATDALDLERFAEEVAVVEAARSVLAFFEGLFRLHDGPITVAQLLEGATPAERAIVKGAFLDAAREHVPEWAPLIGADGDG